MHQHEVLEEIRAARTQRCPAQRVSQVAVVETPTAAVHLRADGVEVVEYGAGVVVHAEKVWERGRHSREPWGS